MAGTLPSAEQCCDPCKEPLSLAVPGPAGTNGAAGAAGSNGANAFTTTTVAFTMPAELANVTITVVSSAAFGIGQILWIEAGGAKGDFEVITKPLATTIEVKNLEDAATSAYQGNSPAGTIFAIGATVSPGGTQGPAGSVTGLAPNNATYITQTPNGTLIGEQALSLLATGMLKSTTVTGLVSIGIDGTDYLSPATGLEVAANLSDVASAATCRANLGLAIGTNVQAFDATLLSIAALGTAAGKMIYTTALDTWSETGISLLARMFLAETTGVAALGVLGAFGGYGAISIGNSAIDCNTAGDTAMTMVSARYRIDKIVFNNATINLTTATVGVFTAAGGGGTTIAADQVLSALTASTKFRDLTLGAIAGTDIFTVSTLYIRIGTPQGAAATARVQIFGWALL